MHIQTGGPRLHNSCDYMWRSIRCAALAKRDQVDRSVHQLCHGMKGAVRTACHQSSSCRRFNGITALIYLPQTYILDGSSRLDGSSAEPCAISFHKLYLYSLTSQWIWPSYEICKPDAFENPTMLTMNVRTAKTIDRLRLESNAALQNTLPHNYC